jgi:hypothetical protein
MAPVNATHLLFAIWAMTQSYADFSAQMALVLNRKQLTKDFDDAEKVIVDMVLAAISVPQQPCRRRRAVKPITPRPPAAWHRFPAPAPAPI